MVLEADFGKTEGQTEMSREKVMGPKRRGKRQRKSEGRGDRNWA